MLLERLRLVNFRNFDSITQLFSSGVNVFYGENGSGKTSLLEALCLFSLGRSFRGGTVKHLVATGHPFFQAQLSLAPGAPLSTTELVAVGDHQNQLKFSVDGNIARVSEVVNHLPMQLLCANSFQMLESGAAHRRHLLDWGCFFFERAFIRTWQRFCHVLKQRNRWLKSMGPGHLHQRALAVWDREFLGCGTLVDEARRRYYALFIPALEEALLRFLPQFRFDCAYVPGWGEMGLEGALKTRFERDRMLGYTSVGPHRGDIDILVGGVPAKQVLSRGQIKLFVCATLVARAEVLVRHSQRACLILVDDVAAELDRHSLARLLDDLLALGSQVVLTSIEPLAESKGGLRGDTGWQSMVEVPLRAVQWA